MLETGSFLQVPDGQLDGGVGSVEPVGLDRLELEVGHEGVVTPVGPELSLHSIGQPGAANDQAAPDARPASSLPPPVT